MKLNDHCRSLSIPFYCAGTLGLNGWIFSDLGNIHEYVIERSDLNPPAPPPSTNAIPADSTLVATSNGDSIKAAMSSTSSSITAKKLEKRQQTFVPLRKALSTTWKGLSRQQQRRNRLSPGLFGVWAIWDLVEDKQGEEDDYIPKAKELLDRSIEIISERGADPKMIFQTQGIDPESYFIALETSISRPGEFSPTCAILGGVLSQDVLNALGGREDPLVNWFQLEGLTGESI